MLTKNGISLARWSSQSKAGREVSGAFEAGEKVLGEQSAGKDWRVDDTGWRAGAGAGKRMACAMLHMWGKCSSRGSGTICLAGSTKRAKFSLEYLRRREVQFTTVASSPPNNLASSLNRLACLEPSSAASWAAATPESLV